MPPLALALSLLLFSPLAFSSPQFNPFISDPNIDYSGGGNSPTNEEVQAAAAAANAAQTSSSSSSTASVPTASSTPLTLTLQKDPNIQLTFKPISQQVLAPGALVAALDLLQQNIATILTDTINPIYIPAGIPGRPPNGPKMDTAYALDPEIAEGRATDGRESDAVNFQVGQTEAQWGVQKFSLTGISDIAATIEDWFKQSRRTGGSQGSHPSQLTESAINVTLKGSILIGQACLSATQGSCPNGVVSGAPPQQEGTVQARQEDEGPGGTPTVLALKGDPGIEVTVVENTGQKLEPQALDAVLKERRMEVRKLLEKDSEAVYVPWGVDAPGERIKNVSFVKSVANDAFEYSQGFERPGVGFQLGQTEMQYGVGKFTFTGIVNLIDTILDWLKSRDSPPYEMSIQVSLKGRNGGDDQVIGQACLSAVENGCPNGILTVDGEQQAVPGSKGRKVRRGADDRGLGGRRSVGMGTKAGRYTEGSLVRRGRFD